MAEDITTLRATHRTIRAALDEHSVDVADVVFMGVFKILKDVEEYYNPPLDSAIAEVRRRVADMRAEIHLEFGK